MKPHIQKEAGKWYCWISYDHIGVGGSPTQAFTAWKSLMQKDFGRAGKWLK